MHLKQDQLKMNYRPDIDGLRAIAILLVLFFHGGLKLFPSGFIGVDIFFVISGFLITGIIHESLEKNRFSFREFYNRRLWRLQPVFICLMVISALVTLLFYLPDDLIQYFKSARKTSLFISNTFFERVTTDYFSPNNNQLPLLHTWSLSIEWQCYLILPIAIYGLYRTLGKQHIAKMVYLLTFLFLALALYCSLHYPTKTYYQLLSRIFEFLMGSCVALGHSRLSFNKYFLNLLSAMALLTLFYIATRHDIQVGFPNGYAFVLCVATGALLAIGREHPKLMLIQFLSVQPLVLIGLISYSLYIWHWPIFVLFRYLGIEETKLLLLLAFGLVFTAAYLSWQFIEKPGRKFKHIKLGYSLTYLLILPILLMHLSDYIIKKHEGYPQRFEEAARIYAQLKQYANPQRPLCLQEKSVEVNNHCLLGAKKSNKTAFMIGDSYSNHYWGFMDVLAQEANLSILAHATAACLSLPGISQYDWNAKVYNACHEQTIRYFNMIQANHYDYVIIGQNWNGYLHHKLISQNDNLKQVKKRIEKALDKALQIIIASGAKPILFKSIELGDNTRDCFFDHIKRRRKYDSEHCDFNIALHEQQWQNDLFSRMKNKYAQLIIIDPKKAQCPNGRCKADINGVPVFRDAGHITDYASYHLANIYLQRYKNPLVA